MQWWPLFVALAALVIRTASAQTPTPTLPPYERLYGSDSIAEFTPPVAAFWDCDETNWTPECGGQPLSSFGGTQYRMATWDKPLAGEQTTFTVYKNTNPHWDAAQVVLVSQPLAAQTLAPGGATVTVLFPALETSVTANCLLSVRIWVATPAGGTRCVLLSDYTTTQEFGVNDWACMGAADVPLTECAVSAGDRIVMEIGTTFDANGNPRLCSLRWGGAADDTHPDCSQLGKGTGREAGYVQYSHRITWAPTPTYTPTPFGQPTATHTATRTPTPTCGPTGSPQPTATLGPPTPTPTQVGAILGWAPQRRTPTPCYVACLPADFNDDCCVDLLDYTLFVQGFEACSTRTPSGCGSDRCRATDLNDDCCTDLLDYTVFVQEFEQCATPTPAP